MRGLSVDGLLHDEALNGSLQATVVYRPERLAVPIARTEDAFLKAIATECQVWGGATSPLIPVDQSGTIPTLYRRMLAGSAIDGIRGLHPHELHYLDEAKAEPPVRQETRWSQPAIALLEYKPQANRPTVEVVELGPHDPWRGIYAACLGTLPTQPLPKLLKDADLLPDLTFEDFIDVDRVTTEGSLGDLMKRTSWGERLTPRLLSMVHLSYGNAGSTAIRSSRRCLPDPDFARFDAGPNVVVVCSPGSIDDLALLWNLRGAHGDMRPVPIGIPLSEVTESSLQTLLSEGSLARNGMPANRLYITSASLSEAELHKLTGPQTPRGLAAVIAEQMLSFGHGGGWVREEVLSWNNGRALLVPLPPDSHQELFAERAFSRLARTYFDVYLADFPLPTPDDVRLSGLNHDYVAGALTGWGMTQNRTEAREISWPSRLQLAKAVAAHRGLDLAESAPGKAGRHAIQGMGEIGWLGNLAHAPLLSLLETMATRHGFGWYKDRLRVKGLEADPLTAVAPSVEDVNDKGYSDFKRVLGNNEKATKYWLLWAERARLIVKGFQLVCQQCDAKQWVAIASFSPPLTCRACTRVMETPFGDRPNIDFKYRLAEPLRRVYEQDAMGHLLVARHLGLLLGTGKRGALVGLHPGVEVRENGLVNPGGEADVLLFTRRAEFVPVEVKRSASGLTATELSKLDTLCELLSSPWSAVAACQYGRDVDPEFAGIEAKNQDGSYSRILLTYDALLDPFPVWTLGQDPFEWHAMSDEEISKRESAFVRGLADQSSETSRDWSAEWMMKKPQRPTPRGRSSAG